MQTLSAGFFLALLSFIMSSCSGTSPLQGSNRIDKKIEEKRRQREEIIKKTERVYNPTGYYPLNNQHISFK